MNGMLVGHINRHFEWRQIEIAASAGRIGQNDCKNAAQGNPFCRWTIGRNKIPDML